MSKQQKGAAGSSREQQQQGAGARREWVVSIALNKVETQSCFWHFRLPLDTLRLQRQLASPPGQPIWPNWQQVKTRDSFWHFRSPFALSV